MMTPKVRKALEKAGWSAKRQIEIGEIKQELASRGFEVYSCVEEFLRSFGNLRIDYEILTRVGALPYHLHFEAVRASDFDIEEYYPDFVEMAGTHLCPVGGYDSDLIILMDSQGKFYSAHCDGFLWPLGDSPLEVINKVVMQTE